MTQGEVETFIIARWKMRVEERGLAPASIGPSTSLLQSSDGADSLDLAVLVSELEAYTGCDPFANRVPEFNTIRDLASLYVS